MIRRTLRLGALTSTLAVAACAPSGTPAQSSTDGPPARLTESAAQFYEQYGAALSGGDRGRMAGFYHPSGATIVFNGDSRRHSNAEIRQIYTSAWVPPQYFAWDSLRFDSLSTSEVLVTGGFRWQSSGDPDTSRFIYAALLVAVDSGLALVFEHETVRPPR